MDTDAIAEIGIDEHGRIYVTPLTVSFPYIYREAMEVGWDEDGLYLCAPPPPRAQIASPVWWFRRIIAAARAQDCDLHLSPETRWQHIPQRLMDEISSVLGEDHSE